jgi:hypothetical protein
MRIHTLDAKVDEHLLFRLLLCRQSCRLPASARKFRQVESQDLAWQPGHDTVGLPPSTDSDEPLPTSFKSAQGPARGWHID